MERILECVPNISEGQSKEKINQIARIVEEIEGVYLLDIDTGFSANRTVITFAGIPEKVVEAAFLLIQESIALIDMSNHKGAHPRFGAVDVCPLVPLKGITMDEAVNYAHQLGERVGKELNIPGYFYEYAAKKTSRKNLANCRSGEYEGLETKLIHPEWNPDFGSLTYIDSVAKTGAIAIGARNVLIAYNVNLSTTSVQIAKEIAEALRESGKLDFINGTKKPKRILGKLKSVKGIGWYLEEFKMAQVSYNLTNLNDTTLHQVFEETKIQARKKNIDITGSELVGLVPFDAILNAANYYAKREGLSFEISKEEKIKLAIHHLGLDAIKPFNPNEKIIEYRLENRLLKN